MRLVLPRLYVIMDAAFVGPSEMAFAQMLTDSGVGLVQYRNKSASTRGLLDSSMRLAEFFRSRGVRFLVNDRPDVAVLACADGVHVGQEDLSAEKARAVVGPNQWVGVSTHNVDQFRCAAATSADYIAVGPVFPTSTKQNPDPVVGLEFIRQVRAFTEKPIVAIGGITLDRAAAVIEAGADSAAVLSDICASPHPAAQVARYLERLGAAQCSSA
jgi:thiamine-phosphate pyrophosphorylase